MSPTPIMAASVPELSGDPGALSTAADVLTGLTPTVDTTTTDLVTTWKGVDTDAYDAPEAPAARQSIPKIEAPMKTISTNVNSVGSQLATAATTIKSLQERRTQVLAKVSGFNSTVSAYKVDDDPNRIQSRELGSERSDIIAEIQQLKNDIDTNKTELAATLAALKAPDPKLPQGKIVAGERGGNYGDVHGPNAQASTMAESYVDEEGVYHAGVGAMAKAELGSAEAAGEWNTAYGDYAAGASIGVGAEAEAHAAMNASWMTGVHGEAGASASAGVKANANASGSYSVFHGSASGEAFAGAEADARMGVDVGYDGISADAGLSAFAGARAQGEVEAGISGASGKAGIDGRAGIGFDANVSASVGLNETKVKFNVGGAIGLGGGVSVDVTVKPKEIVKDVVDLVGFDSDAAMKKANQVAGNAAHKVADTAGDVADKAGDALGKAGSALGKLKPW